MTATPEEMFAWRLHSTVSMIYTITVVMILWEVVAYSVRYFASKSFAFHDQSSIKAIFIKTALLTIPLILLFTGFFTFVVSDYFEELCCDNSIRFIADSASGYVIGLLIIYFELTRISTKRAVQSAREKEIIQKELFEARYEGLKNQVNPHFLFNSFSTLTSLVETDSKAAVGFIDKLSDLYRYILEHDGQNLVSLKCELNFLDDYVYLLQIRHQKGISIIKRISRPIEQYKVPSLSIQTLVENAIKHNSFSEDDPLEILISDEDEGFISVKNLKKSKPIIKHSTKIGLKNLANRIRLSVKKELRILEDESSFEVKLPLSLSS